MLSLVLESDARADSKLPFQLKVSSSSAGSDTPVKLFFRRKERRLYNVYIVKLF